MCYRVSTDATSGEAFTAFTRHFRKQSGGDDNVVVTFFSDEPQAKSSGGGFAFKSKQAARDILSRVLRQEILLRDADLELAPIGEYRMCQRAVRRLCNPCERCLVRKVARLLAQPLKERNFAE